jgi:hypothetical protein
MTAHRDLDRLLRSFLNEGPLELPDPSYDQVRDRMEHTRQRAFIGSWRTPDMNRYLKVGLAAAAGVLAAVVGFNLLPGSPGPGTEPSASPSVEPPAPTVAATAAVIPPLPEGTLAAGTYRLRPFSSETMTIDATVPDGGWVGGPPNAIGGPVGESNGPNGLAVAFFNARTINSDPCHWDKDGSGSAPQEGDIQVGPTVDDLAEALAASSAYESTTPVEVTLGGFSGKRLDLQISPDPDGCDNFEGEENQYFVFGGPEGGQFAQGGANTWQVTIVDVEGTRLIAVLIAYEETSAADLSAAQGILESVVITP